MKENYVETKRTLILLKKQLAEVLEIAYEIEGERLVDKIISIMTK